MKSRVEKNRWKMLKRDRERVQRIGGFFKLEDPEQLWMRVGVLTFGEITPISIDLSRHVLISPSCPAAPMYSRLASYQSRLFNRDHKEVVY